MSKFFFDTYIDLGSSKIRVTAFDKHDKGKIFFSENDCLTILKDSQLNFLETDKAIEKTIFDIEKKTGEYLDSINLMIDTQDTLSVGLSVYKHNEGKKIKKEDIQYLIQDAKQQILKSYNLYNIIHIIVNNYKVDDVDYTDIPLNIYCKKLSIDIFFICFPKKLIDNLKKIFNKHQITINQFICSSYAKSFNYKEYIAKFNKIIFLDIGYEKTSVIFYENEKLKLFNILPIGGNHITKDISIILKLTKELSEKIKLNLNKDINFSEKNIDNKILEIEFLNNLKNKGLSLDLIKKVIFSRIDEMFNLSFKMINQNKKNNEINEYKIILIGNGSKVLDNKSIDIQETIPMVEEIDFFEETTINICESGLKLTQGINRQEVLIIPKKTKKKGIFEKLFYFFK